ncbi:MAG TPA: hypothetical protein VK184_03890 [Nostocaceae cyanobacterium]|nr:hypothetical protein [Nostocaceae cyanobacterium]
MKSKVVNWLTVCLFATAVLSPGLVVLGVVWGKHLELIKTQNLLCAVSKINPEHQNLAIPTENINNSQIIANTKLSNPNLLGQIHLLVQKYQIMNIFQWLILITPICIGLGIIGYDRYLVYRDAVFRQQVEMLERLWQQSIEQ